MRRLLALWSFAPIVMTFLMTAAFLTAAPPEVPKNLKVQPGQLIKITVKGDAKLGKAYNFTDDEAFFEALISPPKEQRFVFQAPQALPDEKGKLIYRGKAQYVISWWTVGEDVGTTTTIEIVGAVPTPPPGPNPPGPQPPGPPPIPVAKGNRVIFVYETAAELPLWMQQATFGQAVRNYLDAKTTKHAASNQMGYRRYDPDIKIDNERDPDMKALWLAARPLVTKIPCVMIAVDGNVEIVDFPNGEEAALAKFKEYFGP